MNTQQSGDFRKKLVADYHERLCSHSSRELYTLIATISLWLAKKHTKSTGGASNLCARLRHTLYGPSSAKERAREAQCIQRRSFRTCNAAFVRWSKQRTQCKPRVFH